MMLNGCHSTLKVYGPSYLTELLSEEDREKFLEITRIRNVYIKKLRDPEEEEQ
jgi:hypothetical protein